VQRLAPTGPILSVFGGAWSTRQGAIQPGQKLFAYTDGVVEARAADRDFYGTDRLERLLVANIGDGARATVKRCLEDVASFSGGGQADDATAVCLLRAG
jgi:serine phosphatase RsbU (regulator of sigma subunit)